MTLKEYQESKEKLADEYAEAVRALGKKYALENNPYKIGDIIRDRRTIIKIDEIFALGCATLPECGYSGPVYTKRLEPNKKGDTDVIYQSNITKGWRLP